MRKSTLEFKLQIKTSELVQECIFFVIWIFPPFLLVSNYGGKARQNSNIRKKRDYFNTFVSYLIEFWRLFLYCLLEGEKPQKSQFLQWFEFSRIFFLLSELIRVCNFFVIWIFLPFLLVSSSRGKARQNSNYRTKRDYIFKTLLSATYLNFGAFSYDVYLREKNHKNHNFFKWFKRAKIQTTKLQLKSHFFFQLG